MGEIILKMQGIQKYFPGVHALDDAQLEIRSGEVMGLIGENGAGKSTLMKILTGIYPKDGGTIEYFGEQIEIHGPKDAQDRGICIVHQELNLINDLTIYENMFITHLPRKGAFLDAKLMQKKTAELFERMNIDLDPCTMVRDLDASYKQIIEIGRALMQEASIIIMDEPTNHLDIDAIEFLEGYLSRSRCTLFMVTHDRYFLDKVCNTVMEMDHGSIYIYKGNYQNFLEKREERIANYNAETDKVRNILRRELEWIRSTPCARTGKARYRINAFYDLKDRASQVYTQKQVNMDPMKGSTRL